MAKLGRNQPCPCGSGVKSKRCCGVQRGPSEDQKAVEYLDAQAQDAALLLVSVDKGDLERFGDEIFDLPGRDLSLQLQLPHMLPPPLEHLREACADEDTNAAGHCLRGALECVDRPQARARLARAEVALRGSSAITPELAACAMVDLTMAQSELLVAALLRSLLVAAGAATTPAGLVIAVR